MISVTVINELPGNLADDITVRVERGTLKALNALALQAQGFAQKSILKGPKTGRIYQRGNVRHQASAPGEPPANDLGFLASSMRIDVTAKFAVDLSAVAPYAVFLEYGTRKMAPRPFLRPAGDKAASKAGEVFGAYIRAELG